MKHTQTHSAQGTNHHPLFSGPVCEWDFYGRGGGRHRCVLRHAAVTEGNHHHPFLISLLEIFLSLSFGCSLLPFWCFVLFFFFLHPHFHIYFAFHLLKLSLTLFFLMLQSFMTAALIKIFFHSFLLLYPLAPSPSPSPSSSSSFATVCLVSSFFTILSCHFPICCGLPEFPLHLFCLFPFSHLFTGPIPSAAKAAADADNVNDHQHTHTHTHTLTSSNRVCVPSASESSVV